MSSRLQLSVLEGTYSVCRLSAQEEPDVTGVKIQCAGDPFFSLTRTADELSLVCLSAHAGSFSTREDHWKIIRIAGILDFSLTGILLSVIAPLGAASISVFTVSTFNTDYILIKENNIKAALEILSASFEIIQS